MNKDQSTRVRNAEIITIGDEIITGAILDTNAAFIGRYLFNRGYQIGRIVSVGDDPPAIKSAVRVSMKKADLVVVTGGLGPTHDDITKKTLCELFRCKTRFDEKVLKMLERRFKRMERKMPEVSRQYAFIPTAAVPVENPIGIAPGLLFEKKVLVMPGVPVEMENMLRMKAEKLIPHGGRHMRERILHADRISEPNLMAKLSGLEEAMKTTKIAFLPKCGRVDIRLTAHGKTAKEAAAKLESATKLLRRDIEENVWGVDDDTMERLIGDFLRLRKRNETLAVAESCSGGGIGQLITSVPGSSNYFLGGLIVYSNEVKIKQLGVPKAIIEKHGAVSRETAIAMAECVKRKFGADYGLSATGISGPGGGTKDKPVGLTFVALSGHGVNSCRRLLFHHDRRINRERTAFEALHLLLERLRAH
ncbi:MAG: CinA-like protein [bacterium]|nr:MAG: CinA-like protein [bacterium]